MLWLPWKILKSRSFFNRFLQENMEFLTILLSSLIGILSPAGIVVDRVVEKNVRQQFVAVEQLQVRLDNAPSYQLVQGKVNRVRIAGRGLFPLADIRIAALDLETDAIAIQVKPARRGKVKLAAPLRLAARLVLDQADLNRALQSPKAKSILQNLGGSVVSDQDTRRRIQKYEFQDPRITFLDRERLRFQVAVKEPGDPAQLDIAIETGIAIIQGRQVQLVQPHVTLNGEPVPQELLQGMIDGVLDRSDLKQLEASGITARILQYRVDRQQLTLVAFVQMLPAASSSSR
jgi:LmeA-like phospholipid-binding